MKWVSRCGLLVLWLTSGVWGQQTTSPDPVDVQPPVKSEAEPSPSTLNLDYLNLQLKQIQESSNLPEDTKTIAADLCTQAIQQFEIGTQWVAKAADYEAERLKAPETLKTIQAEIATPLDDPVPQVPAGASRADLEQLLRQVQSNLDNEKKSQTDWERERDRRTSRRKEIPDLLANKKSQLQKLIESPTVTANDSPAIVRTAQQALDQTRRIALEHEIEAYNSELLSYDARRDLLQARLDRSTRRVNQNEKLLAAWQTLVQQSARKESEQALRDAREQLKRAHPAIRPLAEEREQLAVRGKKLHVESKEVDTKMSETDALLTQINQDFDRIKRRVDATGLTNAIGQLLRKHRGSLPNLRPLERNLQQRKDKISVVQLAIMEQEDRRIELLNAQKSVGDIMATIDADTSEAQRANILEAAQDAVGTLRTDMDSVLKDYDRLFDKLVDLDSKERDLVDKVGRFADYIDEKVLWIKSGALPDSDDIRNGKEALVWLVNPVQGLDVLKSARGTFTAYTAWAVVCLTVLTVVWLSSHWLTRYIRKVGDTITKPTHDNMSCTIGVLFTTIGLAIRWPATLWYMGWLIASPYDATDFTKALAEGINATAIILLTLESVRQLARRNGLAEKHFRWNARALTSLKRHITWLTVILVPSFLVFATIESQANEAANNSLGRLAFVIAFFAISLFAARVLRPAGPVLGTVFRQRPNNWLYRLRYVCFLVCLLLPMILVIAAIVGYYYTSLYLGTRLIESIWLFFGLIVLRSLVDRWLILQTRHRAIDEARQRAAKRQQEGSEQATTSDIDQMVMSEDKLDVAVINKQTIQLARMMLIVVASLSLWAIWVETLPAFGIFREVTLWSTTQQFSETIKLPDGADQVKEVLKTIPITLADVGLALIFTLITIAAVKNIPGFLEIAILQRLPIDAGGRFATTAITRYVILVVGTIMVFHQLGVGWAKVQWLVAAMTVGLGFGLQEIFANLISGLMLLFERPIRIGDTVTVADISGKVTKIRTRATTILGWDRKELIIPNKEFVTGKVINWSLTDSVLRIIIPVGIAYGSDTQLARKILTRIIHEHSNVLADPPPQVLFVGFGDSALNFEVRVYVGSIDTHLFTLDEINDAIDREFRLEGIEIAFPQRDIHVRSIRGSLPVVNKNIDNNNQQNI